MADDAVVHRLRGLDGLRAVAVAGVLLYHADLASVPGGFLGVDVFFALSGYLITSLLLRQWEERGRLDFVEFYRGRARRLLPGLIGMLVGTLVVTTLAVPDAARALRRDLLPALTYVSNWWSVGQHQSYFEQTGRPPLLLHLWSLAVEEQFYLLWPVVLLFVLRRRRGSREGSILLARVAAGGAVASALLMAWVAVRHDIPVPNDPSRAYFGTDTHASALLLGAALAAVWPLHRPARLTRDHRRLLEAGGVTGLAVLVWCYATVSEYSGFLYRGGFLLVGAVSVLVVAELAREDSRLGQVLGVAPMRWVGERSYGIYLWHWPVFELTRPELDVQESGLPNLALRLALTLGLAELSWRYLEVPIRHGALARVRPALERWRARPQPEVARRLGMPAAALSVTLLLATGFAVDRPTHAVSVNAVTTLPPPAPDPDVNPPPLPPLPPGAVTAWGDSVMLGARGSVARPAAPDDGRRGRRPARGIASGRAASAARQRTARLRRRPARRRQRLVHPPHPRPRSRPTGRSSAGGAGDHPRAAPLAGAGQRPSPGRGARASQRRPRGLEPGVREPSGVLRRRRDPPDARGEPGFRRGDRRVDPLIGGSGLTPRVTATTSDEGQPADARDRRA